MSPGRTQLVSPGWTLMSPGWTLVSPAGAILRWSPGPGHGGTPRHGPGPLVGVIRGKAS